MGRLWNKTANTAGLGFSQERGNTERNKTTKMRIGRKGGLYVGGEARYLCIQASGHLCSPGNRLLYRWGDGHLYRRIQARNPGTCLDKRML